ncbi:HAMP domain-containing sensor histidine kinase [Taibaiella chishuiensis]|uniref:histidine kinase n=1 Tax=Taibaiella chishuiensis TaxID=1434707 RepID=A0A2P8CV28_9BACT|nr:ATP-binding protein [Taibaiella chishuiensis]PSK88834.1 signal transduction histidine kinase [Taibaiella chishuiensis]
MQPQRIRTQLKITLLYTGLTAATILLLSVLVYFFAERMSSQDFYKRLDIRAVMVAQQNFPQSAGTSDLIKDLRNEYLEKLPNEKEYFKVITPGTGSRNIMDSVKLPESFYRDIFNNQQAVYHKGDVYYAGILHRQNGKSIIVVVSARNEYIKRQLTNLRSILLTGFIGSTLLIFALGWFFSKQVFLPIRKMTQKVRNINTENLHLRLNTGKKNDEVSDLALTFNNMLDRLETSFESQNNFVSNASHELSTPLTSIIGEAELALQKERSPERYQEAMNIILKEAERLKAIIQSLLSLAQTGFDGKRQIQETLRADELLLMAKKSVDRIYPDNKIRIDYTLLPEDDEKLKIKGNDHLLVLALSNIMLNACKYSENKEVVVAIAASNTRLFLIIKDQGIGIPEQELRYIYDPFFRASNTGEVKGYGIGLPLARNIIRLHDGELVVSSIVNQGTEVQISFPIDKSQPF